MHFWSPKMPATCRRKVKTDKHNCVFGNIRHRVDGAFVVSCSTKRLKNSAVPTRTVFDNYSRYTYYLSELPGFKCFGASPNMNFSLYASATTTATSSSVQLLVGRFCKKCIKVYERFKSADVSATITMRMNNDNNKYNN